LLLDFDVTAAAAESRGSFDNFASSLDSGTHLNVHVGGASGHMGRGSASPESR
jgi:hypothetical protein